MTLRNPMLRLPLYLAAAAVVYLALVNPGLERLRKDRAVLQKLRGEVFQRNLDIASKSVIEERIARSEAEIGAFSKLQLEPLLESYAMRAKSLIGDFAAQAGIVDAEFAERPVRALPVLPGSPVPEALHARCPVAVSCLGDYAAIASFIWRVERELPHVALEALRIQPSGGMDPQVQRAEIVFEWPVKGAERK